MEDLFSNFTDKTINLPTQQAQSNSDTTTNELILTDKFFINNTHHSTILPNKTYLKKYKKMEEFSKTQDTTIEQQTQIFPFMAFEYPLDPFQKMSIEAITKHESVLVAAHTSSGKTVVAEYAISLAIKNGYKVIYTSPIKALSNQKFRDLSEKFNEIEDEEKIGLCTGDVTLNPTAPCIVMTTEILRNLLYKGSDLIRDVKYVIFDEVHYLKDKERGVVWEECISLLNLPIYNIKNYKLNESDLQEETINGNKICCIFLSATIPNSVEFIEWISSIHQMPCHVIYNEKRPIPLSHYVVPSGGEGMYKIVDSENQTSQDPINHSNLYEALRAVKNPRTTPITVTNTITLLIALNKIPCIVFSFARKDCELYALKLDTNLDFLNNSEKETVQLIYDNAIQSLTNKNDRELPAVQNILPMLKRGVGIHHSGLVPVIREIIEILFSENLIKILFCTETFAIGLNVPAKSVLFTSMRKFDGLKIRCINGSEYMQMSGRAGRRGLDKEGTVVSIINGLTEEESKMLFGGKAEILTSSFTMGCNMVLNLIRSSFFDSQMQFNNLKGEEILKRTFFYFINEKSEGKIRNQVREKEEHFYFQLKEFARKYDLKEGEIYDFINKTMKYIDISTLKKEEIQVIGSFENLREIKIKEEIEHTEELINENSKLFEIKDYLKLLNEIYKYFQCYDTNDFLNFKLEIGMLVDILIPYLGNPMFIRNGYIESVTPEDVEITFLIQNINENRLFKRVFKKTLIHRIYNIRVKKSKRVFTKKYDVYKERTNKNEGDYDLCENLIPNYKKEETIKLLETFFIPNCCSICKQIISIDCIDGKCSFYENLSINFIKVLHNQHEFLYEKNQLKDTINNSQRIKYLKIAESLYNLNYLTKTNINEYQITLKGRVACEIRSGSEIILTEMLFNNSFDNLDYLDICSLISCIVCTEFDEEEELKIKKVDKKLYNILLENEYKLNEFFDNSCNNLYVNGETGERIDSKSMSSDLTQKKSKGESAYSCLLMSCCRAWAQGVSFAELCTMTTVFEGSIIRILRRLEEVLRQLSSAARVMGNTELEALFSIANSYIKRDIVFNNSLYL